MDATHTRPSRVLVLNFDYRALTVCSVERAFTLLFLEKAEQLEVVQGDSIKTVNKSYPKPSIIRLSRYINVPHKGVALTRHNIYRRDNHTCQYCGSKRDLSVDHILPKSRDGKDTWKNLVTACKRCNNKKGDLTPEEARMKLREQPYKPSFVTFLKQSQPNWKQYLE